MRRSFKSQQFLPWNAYDGEPLTVTSVRPNSSNVTETVSRYAYYPGPIREAKPSNGVYQIQDCKITFDDDAVCFDLKPRDTVTFDDPNGTAVTWTVKQAQRFEFLRFWDLQCFRLIIQADLKDTIGLYRATSTAGSDGFRTKTLAAVSGLSAVAGRLQPAGWSDGKDVDGKLVRRRRWKAYLSGTPDVKAGDTLLVSGSYYEVVAQDDIEQFDALTVVTCEELD